MFIHYLFNLQYDDNTYLSIISQMQYLIPVMLDNVLF